MTKCGWNDKNPALGHSSDAIINPVDANGQTSRRGFGYHGEQLNLAAGSLHRIHYPIPTHQMPLSFGAAEDMARQRRRGERRKLEPGIDGIVITSVYDEPLDIDLPCDVTRSHVPTMLKRRRVEENNFDDKEIKLPPRNIHGSKLVNPNKWSNATYEVIDNDDNASMKVVGGSDRYFTTVQPINFILSKHESKS